MSNRTKSRLDEEFLTESITLRGTTYEFRELSGEKYEDFVKMAEGQDGTADLATVLRLMIPESLVSPKLTAEQLYAKPMPVLSALQGLVNRMHFTPAKDEKADAKNGTSDEVEDSPGNDSEPSTSSA